MTRRGVVLGAGGVLGLAWAVGALTALEQEEGFDLRTADALIGTSAGSVTAALLGCGVAVEALRRHQAGIPVEGDPQPRGGLGPAVEWDYDTDGSGALPPRPALGPGSPSLLVRGALHPRSVPPMAALSGMLPRGRGSLAPVGRMIEGVAGPVTGPGGWAPHPLLRIVAMDYDTGRRVPFGSPDAPAAALSEAVTASCSIPGWYSPVSIAGRRFVDGGAVSATSLDLLAGVGLDEVFVLAPMASFAYDVPAGLGARVERRWRHLTTRRLLREADTVRRAGTNVTLLGPGPEDLAAIGGNLMNPRRRVAVLETSLRTSQAALRRGGTPGPARDRAGGPASAAG